MALMIMVVFFLACLTPICYSWYSVHDIVENVMVIVLVLLGESAQQFRLLMMILQSQGTVVPW